MKNIALFIDTSRLYNNSCSSLNESIELLMNTMNDYSEKCVLLITPILREELQDKIKNIQNKELPKIHGDFTKTQIAKIHKYYEQNKRRYKDILERLSQHSPHINTGFNFLNLDCNDIAEGCRRQYAKEPPFHVKANEWKDYINQALLRKWIIQNCIAYDLWILSGDSDYSYMKDMQGINVRQYSKSHINDLSTLINAILDERTAFERKVGANLQMYYYNYEYDDICRQIDRNLSANNPYLDIEVEITDIDIDCIDFLQNDQIEEEEKIAIATIYVDIKMSGDDMEHAIYDKEDARYYGIEKINTEHRVKIICEFYYNNQCDIVSAFSEYEF